MRLLKRLRRLSLNRLAVVVLLIFFISSLAVSLIIHWKSALYLLPETKISPAEAKLIANNFPLTLLKPNRTVKRIHFMYKGYKLNLQFKEMLTSWRKMYPEYEILFWTDLEIDHLITRRYSDWRGMYYRQLSNYMERSDVARAFVLHTMGGWYADLDTGCLSRADSVTVQHSLILPMEPYLHALNNFQMRRLVSNAIMYSEPQHPFWLFYLHQLKLSLIGQQPRESTLQAAATTGPVLLTKVALMFQMAHGGVGCPGVHCPHLAPPVQFLPIYDNSTEEMWHSFRRLCGNPTALQLVDFADECHRFEPHNYRNHRLDPRLTYTYHAFIHLNQRTKETQPKADVRTWGLNLVLGVNIIGAIDRR